MASPDATSIEEILEAWGFLTPEQRVSLRDAAARTGRPVEDILLSERMVPEEQVYRAKGEFLGIPYVDLRAQDVVPDALSVIPINAARTYTFVAFAKTESTIHIAMAQPDDFQALEALKFLTKNTGYRTEIHIASPTSIANVLAKAVGGLSGEVETAIREFSAEVEEAQKEVAKEDREVEKIVGEAPVTKAVAVIIRHAIDGRASDIHIEPLPENVRVRFRVDGVLYTSLVLPTKVHDALVSRIKILSNLKIDEQRIPQDGRFSTAAGGHEFDFRVSIMPTVYGEKVAIRILDKSQGALPFETLGYVGRRLEDLKKALARPHGLILITGPTGSGKSTTLYTALDAINSPDVNIVSLEDPVEYHTEGANQTQVNPDVSLTFASGLRSILRQDPDVIMVGEIRDHETGNLVVHAALTGHLVLSTLHTNDAIGAIPRLIDMGIEPFLLAAILRLLGAQRLVKRICQNCKVEVPIPAEFRDMIKEMLRRIPESEKVEENQRNPRVLYKGKGCRECGGKGTKGRIALVEVIPVGEELRAATVARRTYDELISIAANQGFIAMRYEGLLKALAGLVLLTEVLEATAED